jgi:hypothetical protein
LGTHSIKAWSVMFVFGFFDKSLTAENKPLQWEDDCLLQ